ncbi:MAG: endonuclease/exonuclease/phosphatase family protein [Bacteroidota bacterium]|nr:endonuclease/exonuclease/phosphatase family protein [Bacteroidota bacterium]
MKKRKSKLKKIHISFILIYLLVFVSCSNEKISNQNPMLDIDHKINGLEVILTGSAVDSDGTISMVKVDWGDNNINKFVQDDFSNIEKPHTYSSPATYDILITVSDNNRDSTYLPLTVSVDYKDVSLVNIKQSMFKASENEYLILTINLHTYQESNQNEKFNMLTEVIDRMDIDFIALQECAQHKTANIVDGIIRDDNMALIISDNLKESYDIEYNFVWDWAHYGWDNWEEGVAILSKHPLVDSESRYISSSTSVNNITSRKVIYGSYQIPDGEIHIFSAHTHWRTSTTDEEQNNQINNIQLMVNEKESLNPDALTFICGDFNVNPTSDYPWSEGYNTLINNGEYIDTFLEIYPDANNKPAQSIYNTVGGDFPGRIDYIFAKSNPQIEILDSQIIFTQNIVGKISDHNAVLTKVTFVK